MLTDRQTEREGEGGEGGEGRGGEGRGGRARDRWRE